MDKVTIALNEVSGWLTGIGISWAVVEIGFFAFKLLVKGQNSFEDFKMNLVRAGIAIGAFILAPEIVKSLQSLF